MGKKLGPWESQLQTLKKVSDFMGLEPAVYEVVRRPKAILQVALPIKMDDGSVKCFKAFRVHYDDSRGPTKGVITAKSISLGG